MACVFTTDGFVLTIEETGSEYYESVHGDYDEFCEKADLFRDIQKQTHLILSLLFKESKSMDKSIDFDKINEFFDMESGNGKSRLCIEVELPCHVQVYKAVHSGDYVYVIEYVNRYDCKEHQILTDESSKKVNLKSLPRFTDTKAYIAANYEAINVVDMVLGD